MTNAEGMIEMTNDEVTASVSFDIRASPLLRHSPFVIRHSSGPQDRQ
jgi:hypothetical protein